MTSLDLLTSPQIFCLLRLGHSTPVFPHVYLFPDTVSAEVGRSPRQCQNLKYQKQDGFNSINKYSAKW